MSEGHSLISNLYLYWFFDDNVGYALVEPKTKQILLVDPGDYEASKMVVEQLENKYWGAKLSYIFSTHSHPDHIGSNL